MEVDQYLAVVIAWTVGSIVGSFFTYLKHKKAREINLTIHLPLPKTSDDIDYLVDAMGNIQRALNGEQNDNLS